jgi:hypothetical protein
VKILDVWDDWQAVRTDTTGQYVIAVSTEFIYYSTNYGFTWMQGVVNSQGWSAPRFLSLAMSSYSGIAYVGTDDGGIYGSYDFGATWWYQTTISNSGTPVYALVCDGDGRRLLAGSDTVYQSSASGYGWVETELPVGYAWVSLSLSTDGQHATALMDDGAGGRTMYYATTSPFPPAVYYYDDDFGDDSSAGMSTTAIIILSTVLGGFPFVGVFLWLCVIFLKMRNTKLGKLA